jgi:hypothetical protein
MCVPFAILGQRDVHVARRDRSLRDAVTIGKRNRIAQPADTDLVDRQLAIIGPRLHVGDGHQPAGLLGTIHDRDRKSITPPA